MPYLNSSAIRRVEYEPQSQTMQIWFAGGSHAYNFYGVPEGIYLGLIHASSPGTYYDRNIKDRYG